MRRGLLQPFDPEASAFRPDANRSLLSHSCASTLGIPQFAFPDVVSASGPQHPKPQRLNRHLNVPTLLITHPQSSISCCSPPRTAPSTHCICIRLGQPPALATINNFTGRPVGPQDGDFALPVRRPNDVDGSLKDPLTPTSRGGATAGADWRKNGSWGGSAGGAGAVWDGLHPTSLWTEVITLCSAAFLLLPLLFICPLWLTGGLSFRFPAAQAPAFEEIQLKQGD